MTVHRIFEIVTCSPWLTCDDFGHTSCLSSALQECAQITILCVALNMQRLVTYQWGSPSRKEWFAVRPAHVALQTACWTLTLAVLPAIVVHADVHAWGRHQQWCRSACCCNCCCGCFVPCHAQRTATHCLHTRLSMQRACGGASLASQLELW